MKKVVKKKKNIESATDIFVVLDRSGSMGIIKTDAIGGFNQFLNEQKKVSGKAKLTLAQFDHIYEVVHNAVDLKIVPELTDATYQPRNTTALLDAIGKTLVLADSSKEKKIAFVILTDGQENASKEYNRSQIFDMIKDRRDNKGWQFIFLGANQDAIQAGSMIGIAAAQSLTFAGTPDGIKNAYGSTSKLMASYRTTGNVQCFSQDDRDKSM